MKNLNYKLMIAKELIEYYFEIVQSIEKNTNLKKYVYTIYDIKYFKENLKDEKTYQRIYWEEILQRAHWAGLSSLIRNLQWIKGVMRSIEDNNLLSFTSNLRCLIESSGDNLLSLVSIPKTLANNFQTISKCLEGNLEKGKMYASKELEELLIHFSHARKITKKEQKQNINIPEYQNAKHASVYLKVLDKGVDNGPIKKLYDILCQFCHPAAHSIHYLFKISFDNIKYEFQYSQDPDKEHIEKILTKYNNEIVETLQFGFISGILILKILNFFNYELTKTEYLEEINLSKITAWETIEGIVKNSKI